VERAYSEVVPINVAMHYGSLAIRDTDRKLGEVAANLDDMSDSIEELKDAAHEGGSPKVHSTNFSRAWRIEGGLNAAGVLPSTAGRLHLRRDCHEG
jgi:hypothetical protein